jgi:hypothetical protein
MHIDGTCGEHGSVRTGPSSVIGCGVASRFVRQVPNTRREGAMDTGALKRLLPRDKNDVEGARALVSLGYPTVEPVLTQMLEWLKTNGSPVEMVMREFFVSLGIDGVPVVQKALSSRHDLLKYSVLKHIVVWWPAEAVAALKTPLQSLATGSGCYGTDLIALRLLVEHQLADRTWLKAWVQFKGKRLRELLAQAEELERLLEP